ncbi:MAG TPA: type II toxin-antitoxin system VapC family toxin [Stellaceae bacterium]|nr:type II toxin-antitoxin system VapC family toxin [Stellaceae bacterium]
MLLDTCAAVWLMNGDPLSDICRAAIAAAQVTNIGVFVSPITAWEIGTLATRNRIQLTLAPQAWFDTLLEWPGVRLAPMPPMILIASNFLPGTPPRDPADRIIAATAREFGHTIITRNGELSGYAASGHIELIAC